MQITITAGHRASDACRNASRLPLQTSQTKADVKHSIAAEPGQTRFGPQCICDGAEQVETVIIDRKAKWSRPAAQASTFGATLFLLLLAMMHLLRVDLDPSWHFISEYGVGPLGWLMQAAFLAFAIAHFALAVALSCWAVGRVGKIGLVMIIVAGLGLLLGGIFVADPMLTHSDDASMSGRLHNLGGGLGIAMPFAVLFITVALRRHASWRGHLMPVLAIAAVLGSIVTIAAFAVYLGSTGGQIGPDAKLGIFNRLEIICYSAWFLFVALTCRARLAS